MREHSEKKEDGMFLELCRFKHDKIDNDISLIKEELKKLEEDILKEVEGTKDNCKIINDNRYENLKYKVIVSVKSINNKIDSLSDLYSSLKKRIDGNGEPGIAEDVRSIKRNIRWLWISFVVAVILLLGGEYSGVSYTSIKERIFGKNKQEIKKVDESKNLSYEPSVPEDKNKKVN